MSDNKPILDVRHVYKSYGAIEVLKDVSMAVHRTEVVCIIGPSGSGKTTLARCINGLEPINRGEIHILGEQLAEPRRRGPFWRGARDKTLARQRTQIGFVFQNFNLWPHRTVLENITTSPRMVKNEDPAAVRERAFELLDRVGLADKADAYPRNLSGGQQQRVAIARTLAMRPAVIVFDEPTSALDPETTGEVLSVMTDLATDGATMVCVTHEIAFASKVADRVIMMADGVIVEEGPTASVLGNPSHQRTQAFLEKLLTIDR